MMDNTKLMNIDKCAVVVRPNSYIEPNCRSTLQSDNEEVGISSGNPSWLDVWPQIVSSVIALSIVIQSGINMAYSGVLIPQLADDPNIKAFTKDQASWIASLVVISQPIGALVVGPLMDLIGRKKVCIITNIPVLAGWAIIYFTKYSLWPIYLARILAGFSSGMATVGVVYTAEVTHAQFRAMLLSLNSVNVAFGILIATILGVYIEWHIGALLYGSFALSSLVLSFFIPESPYWLANFTTRSSNDIKNHVKYLNRPKWLFDEEWSVIRKLIEGRRRKYPSEENSSGHGGNRLLSELRQRASYLPLIILVILFLLQQTSGTYVVIFYTVNIFKSVGGNFGLGFDEYNATNILGLLRFIMSLVSAVMSKYVGRRPLLISSSLGMALSCIITAVLLKFNNIATLQFQSDNSTSIAVLFRNTSLTSETADNSGSTTNNVDNLWILVGLLCFVCTGALGQMVVPWTVISELLPTKIRASGCGLMVAYSSILLFIVIKTFPFFTDWITLPYVFVSYAIVSVLDIVFIYFYLPETLGKTFTEIAKYFEKTKT